MIQKVISILIIILLLAVLVVTLNKQDCGFYGLWEAELKFKESANLDSMYLLIGAPKGCATSPIGYHGANCMIKAIIRADGETLSNITTNANLRRTSVNPSANQHYAVKLAKPINAIPRQMKFIYDPITNLLIIRDKKIIYAKLYKKPEASAFLAFGDDSENED